MAILSTLLFTLNFYFFNTEMHERYVHPVVLLSGLYCIIEGEYYLFIVLSIAYVLNLERVMNYLQLHNYHTLMMSQAFIGWVFAACIIYAYYKLYSRFSLRKAAV